MPMDGRHQIDDVFVVGKLSWSASERRYRMPCVVVMIAQMHLVLLLSVRCDFLRREEKQTKKESRHEKESKKNFAQAAAVAGCFSAKVADISRSFARQW